jgi:hypothetical protein
MSQLATRPPVYVKPNEVGYLNAGYTDLTDCFEQGIPPPKFVPGQMYLWVLTGEDHLVIGLENAWRQGEALDVEIEKGISTYLASKGKAGHPTLTPRFNDDGTISDDPGRAAIGGELNYSGGQWVIDNNSGRYGSGPGDGSRKRDLMNRAARKFKAEANLTIGLVNTYSKNVFKRWFRQSICSWGFGSAPT